MPRAARASAGSEVTYEAFEVEVSDAGKCKLEIRVLHSPVDRPKASFVPPYTVEEFTSLMCRLAESVRAPVTPGHRALEVEVGTRLFRALFPGPVEDSYRDALATIAGANQAGKNHGLRLRIAFNNLGTHRPEISALPWELLCDPRGERFLARGGRTLVVRYQNVKKTTLSNRATRELRVLGVFPSPKDQHCFDVEAAKRALLEAAEEDPQVQVRFLEPPTLDALRDRMVDDPFDVLHFHGHGAFHNEEGGLFFENDNKGRTTHYVSASDLRAQLEDREHLRLAVLMSCKSGVVTRQQGQDPFTSVSSAVIQAGPPAAIAMQQSIWVKSAEAFTASLYSRLAKGFPVDAAVGEARLALRRTPNAGPFEWATPVITQRTANGKILNLRQSKEKEEVRFAVVSFPDDPERDNPLYGEQDFTCFGPPVLLLREHFKGKRYIKDPVLWNHTVLPRLRRWLPKVSQSRQRNVLYLAAHKSIGFASGYILERKNREDIGVMQGTQEWWPEEGDSKYPRWRRTCKPEELDPMLPDLAVAISTSGRNHPDVEAFLKKSPIAPDVGGLLKMELTRGNHWLQHGLQVDRLAVALVKKLTKWRADRPDCTFHLFMETPNGFNFFLGRHSRVLARIQLYEHDYELGGPRYEPSIRLIAHES